MSVETQLDQLAEMQAQKDVISKTFADLRSQIIPQELRDKLAEIDAEEATASEALNKAIEEITAVIKENVLIMGQTCKGSQLMAVWNKGRISWDSKGLDGFLVAHPEIAAFRKEGDPSVTIRGIK